MVTYAEVVSQITGNYGITPALKIINGKVGTPFPNNLWLEVNIQRATYNEETTGTAPKDERIQQWTMRLKGVSKTDAEAAKEELRDTINEKVFVGNAGWWHTKQIEPDDRDKWSKYFFLCEERTLLLT
jgi:hypothetical protein